MRLNTTSRNHSLRIVKFRWNQSLTRENIIPCWQRITRFVGSFSLEDFRLLLWLYFLTSGEQNVLPATLQIFTNTVKRFNLYMVRKGNRIDRQKVRLPIRLHSPFIIPTSTMSKARVKFSWNPPYIHDWNVREHVWTSNGNVDMSIGQGVESLPRGNHMQLPLE